MAPRVQVQIRAHRLLDVDTYMALEKFYISHMLNSIEIHGFEVRRSVKASNTLYVYYDLTYDTTVDEELARVLEIGRTQAKKIEL